MQSAFSATGVKSFQLGKRSNRNNFYTVNFQKSSQTTILRLNASLGDEGEFG